MENTDWNVSRHTSFNLLYLLLSIESLQLEEFEACSVKLYL